MALLCSLEIEGSHTTILYSLGPPTPGTMLQVGSSTWAIGGTTLYRVGWGEGRFLMPNVGRHADFFQKCKILTTFCSRL